MSTPRPAASGAVPSRSIAAKATETRSNPAVSNGPGLDWPGAVARGQFARVVADAEARGVENCLATTNARELRALADSARYTGKLDLAERALLSLRRRSPNHGALAAYLLGTLNEARGRSATALHWYEEYFRSPGGQELAAEAAAGRIRTLLATRGASAAREAARDYVRDYPRGVGIPTARKILGGE